ncbi:hypothetical protein Hanom_Chr03g00257391 [Helianthus anomalus]
MPNKQPHQHTCGIAYMGGLNLASHIRHTLSLSHSLITLIQSLSILFSGEHGDKTTSNTFDQQSTYLKTLTLRYSLI